MKPLVHWKTSLAGVAAMLVALGHIGLAIANGGGIEAADVMAITSGIGLLFAKDGDK